MPGRKGIGGHTLANRGASDDWITPRAIIDALGPFDLDPCACDPQPWPTANAMLTKGGLLVPWTGRVWCNPPYGPETGKWLNRLASHGDGIALIFARTETEMFHKYVWGAATAALFLRGRLNFYTPAGQRSRYNAGGPSVLVAYGELNAGAIWTAVISGKLKGHVVETKR